MTNPTQSVLRGSRSGCTRQGAMRTTPAPSADVAWGLGALLSSYGIGAEDVVDVTAEYLPMHDQPRRCSNGVPIHREVHAGGGWTDYVLLRDIPPAHRAAFYDWMTGSACPVPSDPSLGEAAYSWDYERFLRLKPR